MVDDNSYYSSELYNDMRFVLEMEIDYQENQFSRLRNYYSKDQEIEVFYTKIYGSWIKFTQKAKV